jgi:hypothetical protein
VVVAVDVRADRVAGVVERLELATPDEPLLQLPEPRFDEGLALGVAVAATPVRDAELAEPCLEAAAGEGAAVVSTECQRIGGDAVCCDRVVDERDRFVGAAAQPEAPADDLTRAVNR